MSEALRTLLAVLPRRAASELDGALLVAAYKREFGELTRPEVEFLRDTASRECRWFPTIAECRDILKRFQRNDDAVQVRQRADLMAAREWQARFDDARQALKRGGMDQARVDALPERWKRVFYEQCLLRRHHDEGSETTRYTPYPPPEIEPDDRSVDEIVAATAEQFPTTRAAA